MCLCACFSSRAADATTYQDWQFTDRANPAVPTVATNSSGVASATMVVNGGGAGWLFRLSSFGTQTGFWDLGSQNGDDFGRVMLTIPVPASGSSHTDLKLRLVQFVDGGIWTGDLTFSLPGATNVGQTVVEALLEPFPGNWVEDEFHWRLEPSPEQVSLCITGAAFGPVLDRIQVDTTSPVAVPKLTIVSAQQHGQILTINWAGGLPPYQVFATSNLLDIAAWQPIGPVVSGTNADITLNGPIGFFKVGGSN